MNKIMFQDEYFKTIYTIDEAIQNWCGSMCRGKECKINELAAKDDMSCRECEQWIKENPRAAASIMGYKVIDDLTALSDARPNICRILDVGVQERFDIAGEKNNPHFIDETGMLKDCKGQAETNCVVCDLINKQKGIFKINQWTDQDITDAKFILRMFGTNDAEASRLAENYFELKVLANHSYITIRIGKTEMLPSLAVGQTIKVEKIAELGSIEQDAE